jgi:hypothetical protein
MALALACSAAHAQSKDPLPPEYMKHFRYYQLSGQPDSATFLKAWILYTTGSCFMILRTAIFLFYLFILQVARGYNFPGLKKATAKINMKDTTT